MDTHTIDSYLVAGSRVHLSGIGGISMSSLAQALQSRGVLVTGSDIKESDITVALRAEGIPVIIGHSATNIAGAGCVIRTAAVHDDNPEIAAARQQGLPVFERAQAFGWLMTHYRHAVCIAGTHGKTSTTAMVTYETMAAGMDPTVMVGGHLPLIDGGRRVGSGDTIVLEACEYCNSFLNFNPTIAVILNVDTDHLDFFDGLEDVKRSFRAFAERTPPDGVVIANGDDGNTIDCLRGIDRRTIFFGLDKGCDVRAENLHYEKGCGRYTVTYHGKPYARIDLLVPGWYNVMNALAAAAVAIVLGIPGNDTARALSAFSGVNRRFEFKGHYHGAAVYDDYAHHPNELKALFDSAESMGASRIVCVFQPHTFTRTKAFFDQFVTQLSRPDLLILADVYAARETNTVGVTSQDLADRIPGARYFPSFDRIVDHLRDIACPGDLILTVGAGELNQVAEALVSNGLAPHFI